MGTILLGHKLYSFHFMNTVSRAPPLPLMISGSYEGVNTRNGEKVRWSLSGQLIPAPVYKQVLIIPYSSVGMRNMKKQLVISISQYCLPSPVVLYHD